MKTRAARLALLAVGYLALLRIGAAAFGGLGKIWAFSPMDQHRFTAMALLTGTLRLRWGLLRVEGDEQVHDGAVFTNWGLGIPVIQAPFHAVAHWLKMPTGFFPDRTIFFLVLAAVTPLVWAAFDRLLVPRVGASLRRHALSWIAALLTLSCCVFPLMACRFLIYEETLAYFVLVELAALSAYVLVCERWPPLGVAGLAALAGLGLLVRPTGVFYATAWGLLVVLGARRVRPAAIYAGAIVPFAGLWALFNRVRTGSFFSLGFGNTLPAREFHTPIERFGSACFDEHGHVLEAAWRLFRALFVEVPLPSGTWLDACHFAFEVKPAAGDSDMRAPFIGPVALLVLVTALVWQLGGRRRSLAALVPYAMIGALFVSYTTRGQGFVWRYAGDFWPFILLACVQLVSALPARFDRRFGLPLAAWLAAAAAGQYVLHVRPWAPSSDTLNPHSRAVLWDHFTTARYQMDKPLPSRLLCGEVPAAPLHNGQGWFQHASSECAVDTFTNVFLGVPFAPDGAHVLRIVTEYSTAQAVRVYVNGVILVATRNGDAFELPLKIPEGSLESPAVMVTIEWTRTLSPPQLHLLMIELV
jgi:hypothetical protein